MGSNRHTQHLYGKVVFVVLKKFLLPLRFLFSFRLSLGETERNREREKKSESECVRVCVNACARVFERESSTGNKINIDL